MGSVSGQTTEVGVRVTDPTTARMRAIAGPQLYRRNAFRITGLDTDANRRTVRDRQRRIVTALTAGVDVELAVPADLDEVRAAFEGILGDPRLRLVDELFWLWDTAKPTCRCPKTLHLDHDRAVRAHSAALDQELAGDTNLDEVDQLWSEAARLWSRALRRDDFWNHVRDRIDALDDKQLDDSVVEILREQLPLTLVRPLVRIVAEAPDKRHWLAGSARSWPVPAEVLDELFEEIAEPLYTDVRTSLGKAAEQLGEGQPQQAATIVTELVPKVNRLEAFVPADRHRRTATVRNDVSLVFNNCATVYMEQVGPVADELARKWLEQARELASDPRGRDLIKQNIAALDELTSAFRTIKERVAELRDMGRPDLAWRMLRDVRRRVGDAPGATELDKMLADLGDRKAKTRLTRPVGAYRPPGRASRFVRALVRPVVVVLFWGLVGVGGWFLFDNNSGDGATNGTPAPESSQASPAPSLNQPGPITPAHLYQEKIADNSPLGTCVATEAGWAGDKASVPSVPCDQDHWGEVLSYSPLGDAPSGYPGEDQTQALTRYRCAYAQKQQGLDKAEYITSYAYPGRNDWNRGGKLFENYTTCVIHRVDNRSLPHQRLTDPSRTGTDIAVTMDMYYGSVWADPPVGLCVQTKDAYLFKIHEVPIVDCALPHWGQILGYPAVYDVSTTKYPGKTQVWDDTNTACKDLATPEQRGGTYRISVTPPGEGWWDNPKPGTKAYGICTLSRVDDGPMTASVK
jgi:hypothetical protein